MSTHSKSVTVVITCVIKADQMKMAKRALEAVIKTVFLGPHMETPHMIGFLKMAKSFLDGEAKFDFRNEILLASN